MSEDKTVTTGVPDLEQLETEVEVSVYQASGPGGQHRNRTYSAVRLKHLPTGIVVTAADSRSQLRNRKIALERLARRLAEHYHEDPPRKPTKKGFPVRRRERQDREKESQKKRLRKPVDPTDS
ncbi:MAG: peptide chain release factor-like protein [Thermoanaerobaculia bacterium]